MKIRRLALGAACGLACAVGGLTLAGGAFAAAPAYSGGAVQGNPQGVKLAERALSAFSHLGAFTYTEQGFFQVHSVPGKPGDVSYYYGEGALQPGFVWADEHATVALHSDQVIWWRDDLTPLGGGEAPVELVANSAGVFSALGNSSHHGCFDRVTGSVPYPSGGQAYSMNGRYVNGTSPLRSVFLWWQTAEHATETDVISSSGLITSGQVRVGAGFTYDFSNAFPGGPGPAPQIHLCR